MAGYRASVSPSRIRTALLALAAFPAVLAGCSSGDGGSDPAAASSAAPSTAASSAPTSPSAAGGDAEADRKATFCAEVPSLLSDITTDLQGIQDPQDAPELVGEAVEQLTAVEPPADAAPQWDRLVAAWTEMRDLLGEADLQDPAANAELAPRLQTLQTELVDSGTAIDDYGKANC